LQGRDRRSHHNYLDSLILQLVFERVVAAAGVGKELPIQVFFVLLDVASIFLVILDLKPVEIAVLLANGNHVLVVLGLTVTHQYEFCVHIYSRIIFNITKISFMLYLPRLLLPAWSHYRDLFSLL
jgi:hypothetical protein